jgi:hypothetical protein
VTSLSPVSGATVGGDAVVITGRGFIGVKSVRFGSNPALSFTVDSSTQITAVAPAHRAGSVFVRVTAAGGRSRVNAPSIYLYVPGAPTTAPTLTTVTPTSGSTAGGTGVTLTGTNFVAGASVTFGGTAATNINVVSATSITCTTPAHAAGAVAVVVTTTGGTATLANGFTYNQAAPTLTTVTPTSGSTAGGTGVTLTGTNFVAGASVTFGGTAATNINVVSATSITCTTPAHAAGAVAVVVTTTGGTATLANGFTYVVPAPVITSVSPNSGSIYGGNYGGSTHTAFNVVITGSNFTGVTAVAFGSTPAVSFTFNSDTQITAVAPAQAAGTVDIRVTTAPGTSAVSNADKYTYYYFQVVNGSTVKNYTLADLQAKTAVSGYGGYLNTFPSFKGPWQFTGASVLSLLADVGGLPSGHGVKIYAADAYGPVPMTYDQVANNNFTMYDPSSDPAAPTIVTSITGSLQLIIAYTQDGVAITEANGGPLRTVIVSPVSGQEATDSVLWAKYAVQIVVQ